MGKHYCDYCDVFLTHDSVSVRKAHNSGRNHLQNVREYYQSLDPAQVQQVIDTLAREYERRHMEIPRDLLQPAGSTFMTFGAGPLSGASDRSFSSKSGPPPMQSRPPAYPQYGPPGGTAPQSYSRPPPMAAYSRPPPSLAAPGGNAYRGPPPGYGAGPPAPYGSASLSGPPAAMLNHNTQPYPPPRNSYGPRY